VASENSTELQVRAGDTSAEICSAMAEMGEACVAVLLTTVARMLETAAAEDPRRATVAAGTSVMLQR
jgi:hypothetical protein